MNNRDKDFAGLLVASGVPVSDAERSELRRAYETLCNLADRVRNPERDWTTKPMPSFASTPHQRKPKK
tara:strand:+ start:439 stop:642 length:204 start_codon:yes stop_codon:yes gene_type:complete